MHKIDVERQVREMERILRTENNLARCEAAITVLRRWQFDEMLDDCSREKARMLVLEFDSSPPNSASPDGLATDWSASAALRPGKP